MHNEIEQYLIDCTEKTLAQRAKRRKENALVYITFSIFIFGIAFWAASTL